MITIDACLLVLIEQSLVAEQYLSFLCHDPIKSFYLIRPHIAYAFDGAQLIKLVILLLILLSL